MVNGREDWIKMPPFSRVLRKRERGRVRGVYQTPHFACGLYEGEKVTVLTHEDARSFAGNLDYISSVHKRKNQHRKTTPKSPFTLTSVLSERSAEGHTKEEARMPLSH